MDRSAISSILRELNLNENSVANIYNYGSWVYGTNSPTSDRDLMIVTRSHSQDPLEFDEDFDYFHSFELHKLWNQYDVCVHSVENFEQLLEKNYLLAIECIFLPDEFKIKEEIDFRPIYLEKYYDKSRLKKVAFYENLTAMNMYNSEDNSNYPKRSSRSSGTSQSSKDYLFKILFHGFRYLDFAEQLIQTRSIYDFKRVTHIFSKMKDIRGDPTDDSHTQDVLNFVQDLSTQYKAKLDSLVPTNIVKGTFEAHVTFECSHDTQNVIEKLKKTCEKTKYKIIFIDLDTNQQHDKLQQLMTSSYHCGEYPAIVKQIEEEVYKQFQDFNIIRIKIESLASNEGVPQTDIDKKLFWDKETNYFEFHYKVLIEKDSKGQKLAKLRNICQSNGRFHLHVSRNAFKQLDETNFHYMITMRLFDVGRENAFKNSDEVIEYLTKNNFPPLKVVREFIVYDTHIELDSAWK
ncbi:unnamed protein product [Rotaria sp. Silwood1]|nr:unnamed protein product [Rotaria sp. Silwood1]CAF3789997.1 unnamed protein product [Rotaria sp. Silwood1]CAF4675753.1 unnamed protein product [Rotaria sp. Silwood1]CAF4839396.1 unnamed protein product [Rotaria sp. Silwood1]